MNFLLKDLSPKHLHKHLSFSFSFFWLNDVLNIVDMEEGDADVEVTGSDFAYKQTQEWFKNYFLNKSYHLPIKPMVVDFNQDVLNEMSKIPLGSTLSYSELATSVGKPKAARAVGYACGCNSLPLIIPCHRVIAKDGSLGGFRYGAKLKQALLDLEKQIIKFSGPNAEENKV